MEELDTRQREEKSRETESHMRERRSGDLHAEKEMTGDGGACAAMACERKMSQQACRKLSIHPGCEKVPFFSFTLNPSILDVHG